MAICMTGLPSCVRDRQQIELDSGREKLYSQKIGCKNRLKKADGGSVLLTKTCMSGNVELITR